MLCLPAQPASLLAPTSTNFANKIASCADTPLQSSSPSKSITRIHLSNTSNLRTCAILC